MLHGLLLLGGSSGLIQLHPGLSVGYVKLLGQDLVDDGLQLIGGDLLLVGGRLCVARPRELLLAEQSLVARAEPLDEQRLLVIEGLLVGEPDQLLFGLLDVPHSLGVLQAHPIRLLRLIFLLFDDGRVLGSLWRLSLVWVTREQI